MIVALFRSRLSGEAGEEYAETVDRMLDLARKMPGFVSFKQFTAGDGERLSVIEFDSEEHLTAWREHPDHRKAQVRGREKFYSEYRLTVAETLRDYGFRRDQRAPPAWIHGGAPLPRPISASRYCAVSRISGSPSFPAPMITTLALGDAAIFSVASIPFQRRS